MWDEPFVVCGSQRRLSSRVTCARSDLRLLPPLRAEKGRTALLPFRLPHRQNVRFNSRRSELCFGPTRLNARILMSMLRNHGIEQYVKHKASKEVSIQVHGHIASAEVAASPQDAPDRLDQKSVEKLCIVLLAALASL